MDYWTVFILPGLLLAVLVVDLVGWLAQRPTRSFNRVLWIVCGGACAILLCITVPNYERAAARGPFMSCESNEKNIGTALEM